MTNILFRAVVELVASALKPKQLSADIRISNPAQFLQVLSFYRSQMTSYIHLYHWSIIRNHRRSYDVKIRACAEYLHVFIANRLKNDGSISWAYNIKKALKTFLLYCQSSLFEQDIWIALKETRHEDAVNTFKAF